MRRRVYRGLLLAALGLGALGLRVSAHADSARPAAAHDASTKDARQLTERSKAAPRQGRRDAAEREARERGAQERYERKRWPHWLDLDGDCQNTRHEVLIAAALSPVKFKGRRPCQVLRGSWRDAYTGEIVNNPAKLDVDHVVPLAEAYRSGGFRWPADKRRAYANDMAGLVLTRRGLNRAKGDQDPATWLPPNPTLHCTYARHWAAIKSRWALEMDDPERAALERACL